MDWREEPDKKSIAMLIREIESPPPHVDVGRALQAGRRAATRRRYASVVVAAVVVVVVVAGSSVVVKALDLRPHRQRHTTIGRIIDVSVPDTIPVADCTITRLPAPAEIVAHVGGDVTGHYQVGTGYNSADGKVPLIRWKDGIATVIDDPYGVSMGTPRAVNSRGVVVGEAQEKGSAPGTSSFAWVYRDGVMRKLPGLNGYGTVAAYDVNERGDIVGWAGSSDGSIAVAIIWPADAPDKPRRLDAPNGARASGITDDGTVVGSLVAGGGTSLLKGRNGTPYVWSPNGRGHALTVPMGMSGGQVSRVRGNIAVGYLIGARDVTPASWDLRTGDVRVFGNLPGVYATADAVNAAGWIVVNAPGAAAVIVRPDGTAVRLPRLPGAPPELARGSWISADGRTVIGNSPQPAGLATAVIWQCRPW
jgi:hypothetical protein